MDVLEHGRLMSVKEAASLSGLSPYTIRAWVRARRIPFRRLGRRVLFHPLDIAEMVESARMPALGALVDGSQAGTVRDHLGDADAHPPALPAKG